jgi:glycosyltransferase involved in cell wall biosynthesis
MKSIDRDIGAEIVLVDDFSTDDTAQMGKRLGLHVFRHDKNMGYGANQKTCYQQALDLGADIVIMVQPDYQYSPKLIPAMSHMLASDLFDICLGSRILSGGALRGGMPLYKYIANRLLTLAENLFTGMKLSEYHTGYRAFTRAVLQELPLQKNSDDFVFDNQILLQAHYFGFRLSEVTCPTAYFEEASSINFRRSVQYGLGCMWNALLFTLARSGIYRAPIFVRDTEPEKK